MKVTRSILILTLIAFTAGYAGYRIFMVTDFSSTVLTIFSVSLILFLFRSKSNAWDALKILLNPFQSALIFFLAGFMYFGFKGFFFIENFIAGLGILMIGGAFSTLVFKYWNIGA